MTTTREHEEVSEHEKMINQALHFTVGRICEEVGAVLEVTYSREVIATLADVVRTQCDIYSTDLVAFAKHAKRSTVNVDDVYLLLRRNKCFHDHVKTKMSTLTESATTETSKPKKQQTKKKKPDLPLTSDEAEEAATDLGNAVETIDISD